MAKTHSLRPAAFALFAGLSLAGCEPSTYANVDYGKAGLVDVTGTVTLDRHPLPNAVISFDAPDGQFSFAQTDSQGKYELQFDSQMHGVTPGEKVVRITTTRRILGLNVEEEASDQEAAADAKLEKVPAKYNKESELKATVAPGEDQTFNFDLKSS